MRPEDLVFWLDVLPEQPADDVAVLCRRHADAMVVPRGWTLDDLRDPDLHLFRPPVPLPPPAPPARARRPHRDPDATGEQLRLHTDVDLDIDPDTDSAPGPGPDIDRDTEALTELAAALDAAEGDGVSADGATDAADPGPWSPAFDEADDLEGLLSARSPLLSRAFRTADRSDR
jgi:hypothetical protein